MTFIDLLKECCNSAAEIHAVTTGYATGLNLGMGIDVPLDGHWIPLVATAQVRQDCEDEWQYYWAALALGRASMDPALRNRVEAALAAILCLMRVKAGLSMGVPT